MKICVFGMGHLGRVAAACLAAERKHRIIALDLGDHPMTEIVNAEPKLWWLWNEQIESGNLGVSAEIADAVEGIDLLWVTYDTPVDANDQADSNFVMDHIERVLPYLRGRVTVLISSQLPVGSTALLEEGYYGKGEFAANREILPVGAADLSFAYLPENLRRGKAIHDFRNAERIVVGLRENRDELLLTMLFAPFAKNIEFMSAESAEMTNHALNAFLGLSICFINEIAAISEKVGAIPEEVARGLKSEPRIGQRAYLTPGGPFTGGTLGRDVAYLEQLSKQFMLESPVIEAIHPSNSHARTPVT